MTQYDTGYLDIGVNAYANPALEPNISYKYVGYNLSAGGSIGLTMQPSDISWTAMFISGPCFIYDDYTLEVEAGVGINYGVEPYFTNLKQPKVIRGKILQGAWSIGANFRFYNRWSFSLKACSPGFIQLGARFSILRQ